MSSNEQTVLGAVKQEKASKKQSALQKLFAVWFDAFVYNQIWEDPRVDLAALKLDKDSRILTISSGGCNAMNYLVEEPESVTAVDLNRHHIYLLNLKAAALEHLPRHEDFFAFFGEGKNERNVENYVKFIKPNLDDETTAFWEKNSLIGKLIYGKRINFFKNDGLYEHSRNGYFLRVFHRFSRILGCKPDEVLKAKTLEEQEKLYKKFIAPFFDSFIIQTIGKMPVTLFGLGIPPQQYDELKRDLDEGGSIVDIYRERTKKLAVEYPIQENYFAWQAFSRKYDTKHRKAIPEYLKEENYDALKACVGNLKTEICSVTDEISRNVFGTFNRFVFLDAQDWMDRDAMTDLWSAVAENSKPGSRVIFRTAGASSPLEKNLPKGLRGKFHYEEKLSEKLFREDRASIYGGFHLYVVK